MPAPKPSPEAELDGTAVLAWRWSRAGLASDPPRATPKRIVGMASALCGVQAQVMSSALGAFQARLTDLRSDGLDELLWKERALVKTWSVRGTLHLLPADELGLWVAAQGVLPPRHHSAAWERYHGVTRGQVDEILASTPKLLSGRELTRAEFAAAVEGAGISGAGEALASGWGAVLKLAAMRGDLIFAPSRGREVTFTHPASWLGAASAALEPEEAASEVARRFLGTYGPSDRERFARWFGHPSAARAGKLIEGLGDLVAPVTVDGESGWALRADLAALAAAEPSGRLALLPAFDQFTLTVPRSGGSSFDPARKGEIFRPQGWVSPVIAVDGRIVGTWKLDRAPARLDVELNPFARLSRDEREQAEAEAERFAGLESAELSLTWT